MRDHPLVAILVIFVVAAVGAAAQQGTTVEDHERADAAYLERLERAAAKADAAPGPLEDFDLFVETAESLIRDQNYRSATGERYRVQTDDPRLDPKAAVALLESFATFVDERWSDRLELRPFGEPSRVFLFYSFHRYNKLLDGDYSRSFMRPKGHYGTVIDVLAAHTDADFPGGLADSLIHEAAHQIVARRLFPAGTMPSPWITEGLAGYFGYTRRTPDGGFVEGELGGKRAGLIRDEREGRAVAPGTDLRGVRRALREGTEVAAGVVDIESFARFYSGSTALNYGVSWVMIHALLHGDDGAHAAGFVAYLERERQGESGFDVLREATGLERAGLDELLRRHLKTLRVR